ncbi:MAG: histidine kinase [Deltaproteobacteria bacterium]|nr:histidine kinase [Deltaproteobacteria bacterium]
MRKVLWVMVVCCFVMGLAMSNTYAAGQADAKALIEKGVAFYKANGQDKAFAEFSNPKGQFTKGDLYIFVIDSKGKVFAHGGNPTLVGKNVSELKDADGKFFMKEIIKTATEKGKGWVDYKWTNPVTKKVEQKTTYVEKVGDYVFGCGVYKE